MLYDEDAHRFPDLPNSNDFCDSLEQAYLANRHAIIRPDGLIMTPLNILRELGKQFDMPLHFDYHEIHIGMSKLYMVELFVGFRKGCGESTRRKMAAQLAAADLLDKLKRVHKDMPAYGLFPGCRIHPTIFGDLLALCEALGAQIPVYIRMPIDPQAKDPPLYSFKCQIGQMITIGNSDSMVIAKRWAALEMYESLTGIEVLLDRVFHGPLCTSRERYGLECPPSDHETKIAKATQEVLLEHKKMMEASKLSSQTLGTSDDYTSDLDEETDNVIVKTENLNLGTTELAYIKERISKMNIKGTVERPKDVFMDCN